MTTWTVLDNSNIVESYPGITLPLTASFVSIAYKGVFTGLIGASITDKEALTSFDQITSSMVECFEGRIYYRLNSWYALLSLMPFSRRIIPIWQEMLGVNDRDIRFTSPYHFTAGQKMSVYRNMARLALHVRRDMSQLARDFVRTQEYFDTAYAEAGSIEDLLQIFAELDKRILNHWHVTLVNDMYCFLWTAVLKRQLTKRGLDVTESMSGITGLESLKPVRTLMEIAQKYGDEPDVLSVEAVQDYLRLYGDRSPYELKLEAMTYREDPSLLLQQIREYADDKENLERMIAGLDVRRPLDMHSGALKRVRIGIANREISRLNRSRIYGMVRRIFTRVGDYLCEDGWIDEPRDVFYLKVDELQTGDRAGFRETVSMRKTQYDEYEKLPARPRIVFRDGVLTGSATPVAWTRSVEGTGVSAGKVTAEAIVVTSPYDVVDARGKIIVTTTTDPGWVFLLATAAGIVAEKGSLLSHTAIVSRELEIPAVVGVESATTAIRTGDLVSIDGESGRVEIVDID